MKSVVGEISKGVSGIGAVCVIAFGARRGIQYTLLGLIKEHIEARCNKKKSIVVKVSQTSICMHNI